MCLTWRQREKWGRFLTSSRFQRSKYLSFGTFRQVAIGGNADDSRSETEDVANWNVDSGVALEVVAGIISGRPILGDNEDGKWMATEASLKQALTKKMREVMPGAVIFRHEDKHIFGVPDISCTWGGMTSWWEVKYATPYIHVTEVQLLNCRKLDNRGSKCGFIVFQGKGELACHVVDPIDMKEWDRTTPGRFHCTGFNFTELARYIKGEHLNVMGR